jgi:cell division protein FtsZ
VADHARTVAPHRLDPYGRVPAVRNPVEEKVLDIPHFLNRRAN